MSDNAVYRFARELATEVEEGLTDEAPFSANVFTCLVLEGLEEPGHFEGTFDLHQEGRLGNAGYRIDGFAFDQERARLELFTTIYHGDLPPARVPAAAAARAFERALRFASASVDGLADRLEPSNTDASALARRIEAEAPSLATIRIVLLSDGVLAGAVPKVGEWKGRRVEFDVYDIVCLQRILGEGETRADILSIS